MRKVKIYENMQVLNDLLLCLSNDIINGNNMLVTFAKLLPNVSPVLRNVIIKDMWKFINAWHELVNETSVITNKKYLSKFLCLDMLAPGDNFKATMETINIENNTDHSAINKNLEILSFIKCIRKAVIQTSRRKAGLDNNKAMSLRKQVMPFIQQIFNKQ